jgi:hypothetical protein
MAIEFEPFKASHLANFTPHHYDRHNLSVLRLERGWIDKAVTFTLDGEPIGFAGWALLSRTLHLWVMMGEKARARPIEVTRLASQVLPVLQDMDIDQIAVDVTPEFEGARRWAEYFGFEQTDGARMVWRAKQ